MLDGQIPYIDRIRATLHDRFAVNRAVGYMLVTRGWQFVSAPLTIYFLFLFFDERLQGYYYLFLSLLATQIFFELGLNTILALMASHEWSQLSLTEDGQVQGSEAAQSRLYLLVRLGDRWYRSIAGLYVPILLGIGFYFIDNDVDSPSLWASPWIAAVIVNAVSLCYQPRLAILEGCHQVATVNKFRMLQATTGTAAVWTAMSSGAELWTIMVSNLVRLLWEVVLVGKQYREFFRSVQPPKLSAELSWREEVWPLQWRLAIQSVGGYFSNSFFIPVIDEFHGKEAAGRIGMTWSILTTLQAASLAWIQTRLPEFGTFVARGEIGRLESSMRRIGLISVGILGGSVAAFAAAVWFLSQFVSKIAERFLEPSQILLFGVGLLVFQIVWIQHAYVRLFKRDPFLLQNVGTACLTGAAAWFMGRTYGATGIAASYLAICLLFTLPLSIWVWTAHRSQLHTS